MVSMADIIRANKNHACEIIWQSPDSTSWRQRYNNLRRASLLQSPDYARACAVLNRQTARGAVIRIGGVEAGIVQVLETRFLHGAVQGVALDRGPLWLDGFGAPEHQAAFFRTFAKEYPPRLGRRRRVIPEAPETPGLQAVLHECGFRRLPGEPYKTIWLDLEKNMEKIKAGLRANWRNHLNQAEKSGLAVKWDSGTAFLPWLLRHYQRDRVTKGYSGPSVPMAQAMARAFSQSGGLLLGRAMRDDRGVAAVLILSHGASATYQVGWSGEEGRKLSAHNLLLWGALGELKQRGVKDFDLGGINDETAKGVTEFKRGMGGDETVLCGAWS